VEESVNSGEGENSPQGQAPATKAEKKKKKKCFARAASGKWKERFEEGLLWCPIQSQRKRIRGHPTRTQKIRDQNLSRGVECTRVLSIRWGTPSPWAKRKLYTGEKNWKERFRAAWGGGKVTDCDGSPPVSQRKGTDVGIWTKRRNKGNRMGGAKEEKERRHPKRRLG